MSQAVSADAQFSTARVLRPQDNFEVLYQGLPAITTPPVPIAVPIPFFEWPNRKAPNPRDPQAGQDGFSPNLLNFLKVPYGSVVKIWVPQIVQLGGGEFPTVVLTAYRYIPVWRNTSLGIYNAEAAGAGQYHIPFEVPGAPDSLAPSPRRFILPAATSSLAYNQVEPVDPFAAGQVNIRRQWFVIRGGETPLNPVISPPLAAGEYQQGIIDTAVLGAAFATVPIFEEIQFDAMGDQMLIVCDRPAEEIIVSPTWDFTPGGVDSGFSDIYGRAALSLSPHPPFPDVGIYVWTGTAP